MRRLGCGFAVAVLMASVAQAETRWDLSRRPVLVARSTEPETDTLFWAFCRTSSAIELRVGADFALKAEPGQPVSLRLESAGRAATLRGTAQRSDNFQMTAGVELVTEVTIDDPVFAVLRTGKAITVTGATAKPETLGGSTMKTTVERFLAACRGR